MTADNRNSRLVNISELRTRNSYQQYDLSSGGENKMKEGNICRIFVLALCAGFMVIAPVQAEESSADNGWQFAAAVYLWGADIGGHSASGSEVDISFNDIFDNLNAGFMGTFEARKDKWLVLTDVVYLDVSADDKTKVTVPVGPGIGPGPVPVDITAKAEIDLKGRVFQLAGGYNLISDGPLMLDLLAGARYLDLDTDISVDLSALGRSRKFKASESGNVWDGIVGVKGNYNLNPRWSLPYYADIGTGQSDFTWQVAAGVSYHAAKWEDIAFVYRHLEWDIGGDFVDELNFSGPALGAVFRF